MKFTPRPQKESKGNLFLKLGDGDSIKGIFKGDIYTFYAKWVTGKLVVSTGNDPDAHARHKLNFITSDEGKYVAKIFEFSDPVYEQLMTLNEEYPLEQTLLTITRKGSKQDTRYSFIPARQQLTELQMDKLQGIELNVLDRDRPAKMPQAKLPPGYDDFPPPSLDDMPHDVDEIPF